MFTLYRTVKRSVAESLPDRDSVHTRNAAFEAVSAPEKYCSAPLLKGVKRIYGVLYWTTSWSTFGLLLNHFWSTHLSLVLMIVASFLSWSTFGLLLDHFWSTHLSLVLMTVASFLLLRGHVASHAPTTRSSMRNLASL